MPKSKMFINFFLALTILFCFHLNHNSIAGDCDDISSGGGIPTVTGDHNIPENWNPGLQFDPNNPDEIAPNSSISLNVIGGCPPYTLSVSGNGFSMTGNTLFSDDTACGSATITVTDACGNNATGYVRSTSGRWVLESTCNGQLPGCSAWHCSAEVVIGKNYFVAVFAVCDQSQAPDCCGSPAITSCGHCPVGDELAEYCTEASCSACCDCEDICLCKHLQTYVWECN
jgi:hypothetical protein